MYTSVYLFVFIANVIICGLQGKYYPAGYEGCFKDSQLNRTLDLKFPDSQQNSGDNCKTTCREFRFRFAGTQYGKECFCGDIIKNAEYQPESECNVECTGNADEFCGGNWRISIYDNWQTSSTQKQTTPVWPSRTTTTDTKLTEEVQTPAGNSGHSTKTDISDTPWIFMCVLYFILTSMRCS